MAKVPAFRIAMRTTDDGWWIGMLARIENLDDAVELGRIRRGAAENEKVRNAFINVCKMMMTDAIKEKFGVIPGEWQVQKPIPPSKGSA